MGAWKSSTGLTVNVEPFLDKGYKIQQLKLWESLGGELAGGSMTLYCDGSNEALELITTIYNLKITLKKDVGVSYEIDAFIMTRKYLKNILELYFLCIPGKNFFANSQVLKWPDITTALESLWPGKKDFRCSSDINNGIEIFQTGDNDWDLCRKLAYSFKKKSIFAFGLGGFMIKDLIGKDSTGRDEPYWTTVGGEELAQETAFHLNYDYKLYKKNEDPWEEESNKSVNLGVQILDRSYKVVGKDYSQLMDNYVYNTNLMTTRLYNSMTLVVPDTLPEFKIGDVVKYTRAGEKTSLPWTTYLVSKIEIFISMEKSKDNNGMGTSCTVTFRGLEQDGQVMPDTDPADN